MRTATTKTVGKEWKHSTNDNYDYEEGVVGQVGSKRVRISIKANNDAHIALGETDDHNSRKYEIVIGGWGN